MVAILTLVVSQAKLCHIVTNWMNLNDCGPSKKNTHRLGRERMIEFNQLVARKVNKD